MVITKMQYRVPPTPEQIAELGITTSYKTVMKAVDKIFEELVTLGNQSYINKNAVGTLDGRVHERMSMMLSDQLDEYWRRIYYGKLNATNKGARVRVVGGMYSLMNLLNGSPTTEIVIPIESLVGKGRYSHEKHGNPFLDESFNGKPVGSIVWISDNIVVEWDDQLTNLVEVDINTGDVVDIPQLSITL